MMKICHVISGLGMGGAEKTLLKLVEKSDPAKVASTVISLTGKGRLGKEFEKAGIPVFALHMKKEKETNFAAETQSHSPPGHEPVQAGREKKNLLNISTFVLSFYNYISVALPQSAAKLAGLCPEGVWPMHKV